MSNTKQYLGLDVGSARIGVAAADDQTRIAVPLETIEVGEMTVREVGTMIANDDVDTVVVGYPRNQSGEATAQTASVEAFVNELKEFCDLAGRSVELVYQDESLTSVLAEQRLQARGQAYQKADIDAEAAVIILQDYLETN